MDKQLEAQHTRITVAISTFNESRFNWVVELLESLQNQTLKDFEVIIIVNENEDYFKKLAEIAESKIDVRKLKVKVSFNPAENGIAHSRNLALRYARSPYVAYTDDDAIPHYRWLEELLRTLESGEKVGAATGPVKLKCEPEGAENAMKWFPKELYWSVGCTCLDMPQLTQVRNGFGSNLALKKTVALQYGGFNEAFGYNRRTLLVGEEAELGIKLIRANYTTLWNPKAMVYHRVPRGRLKTRNIVKRSFIEGKTKATLAEVYGSWVLRPELGQMQYILKCLTRSRSTRSNTLVALSTIAVLSGYAAHRLSRLNPVRSTRI